MGTDDTTPYLANNGIIQRSGAELLCDYTQSS